MILEKIKKLWNQTFLDERPSISLSFFRIAMALTTGLHVIPTLVNLQDNYFKTAFKTMNPSFFTKGVLELVANSPDAVVVFFTVFFYLAWFCFLIGFCSQISCILTMLSCYYFYALNAFHVGTLSWDIYLVTMFLMCITNYHGDYFSVDSLIRKDNEGYKRKRPFFIQALLQMQLAFTFFYTALYKTTAEGNWIKDNPIYYLVNYPPEGVVKTFLFKEWFQDKPELCYLIGISIIVMEFAILFLLVIPRTRRAAISVGIFFQFMLIITLDVPAIFFWQFPFMFLLFIPPESIIAAIDEKRIRNKKAGRGKVLYDGKCQFCMASIAKLEVMDLFGVLEFKDYHKIRDLKKLDSSLTSEKLHSEIHLIEPNSKVSAGFFIFRRLSLKLPMLYPLIPIFYFPGTSLIGPWVYRLIANNRYLFHLSPTCKDNACKT